MAQFYQAPQLQDTLRWRYTCSSSSGGTHAIGYCADSADGCSHDTADEAEACYRRWLLDKELALDSVDERAQLKCKVCGRWTQKRARVGTEWPRHFYLCDEHRTREAVARLMAEEDGRG